jgi:hypothetical protein
VLLHDVMVAHGSPEIEGKTRRRTIYYEFRSAEQIMTEGPWDAEWVDRRLRLIPLGLDAYQAAFPEQDQFSWQVEDAYRPAVSSDHEHELKVAHVVHTGGAFCSAGDVPSKKS